jgi:uncharacterized repeat protein (TIGR01451 family)
LRKGLFVVVLAMAAIGAMTLAGAGSAAKPGTGATPAPRATASHVHASLVRQVGLRNYAGPNCPGRGWNCTTATRVLQVATAGGTNVGVCTGGRVFVVGHNQSCSITQVGGVSNTARCTEQSADPAAVQTCVITQSGDANYAYVNQNINQVDTSYQTGKQTATVTQGPASVTNYLQLSQAVNQSTKTGNPQTQQAGQSANIEQTATGGGTNYSALNQTELQKQFARGTTQTQGTTAVGLPDCNPTTVLTPGPTDPNVCAVVLQHSASGANVNHLRQNVNEDQNATGQATQTQGSSDGGLDGRVHQDTVSGTSLNDVSQSKNQHQTAAAGSTQVQHDPVSCCGFASQDGGTGDTETINQSSSLSASGDSSPEQHSDLIGTSRTPDGTCTVTQKAGINQHSANNVDTESPCPFLTLTTSCEGGSEGGCSPAPPDLSNPAPPLSALSKGVRNNTDSGFDNATSVVGGGTVEYQLVYGNNGTGDAHNVVVTDTLPLDATYVADSCSPSAVCSYDSDARTITWRLGTVGPPIEIGRIMGFSATVPNETADIVNTAGVDTSEEEPVSSNEATVIDTLAAPISGLAKAVRSVPNGAFDNSVTFAGPGTAEFQILYSNSGNGAAHNVVVTDVVPSGLSYVDASCSPACSYDSDSQTITWNLGAIDPTGNVPVELLFQVTVPNQTAQFVNTASVDTDEEDPTSSGSATVFANFLG